MLVPVALCTCLNLLKAVPFSVIMSVRESVTLAYDERVVGASNKCTHVTDAQSDKISTAVFFK